MNENGKKISEDKNETKKFIIGVLGNINKGKTFLLQALSGEKIQPGKKINTSGLSIKYLEDKFVLLDCLGSEFPILGDNTDLQNILQKQQQTIQMMSNVSKMLSDTALAIIRKIG